MGVSADLQFVTAEQEKQYREEGYFILDGVIPPAMLETLREECAFYTEQKKADSHGLNSGNRTFTESGFYKVRNCLNSFLFGPLTREICLATIGTDAFLFNEFFVVKNSGGNTAFNWHQDSGYVGYEHRPYVTLWIALDDMTKDNGTTYILPYSRAGGRDVVEHAVDEISNDKVGYHGDDSGEPALIPAGSIVVFSSTTFHRSSPNVTDRPRRAYIVQFTPDVLMNKEGTAPLTLADAFLKYGQSVT